jgi:two-component system response regulator MtrA
LFRAGDFDLIVLDVMLPSVDGFAICKEVRKSSKLPIVMLTARSDTTDIVVGLELGADDYVTKPFEMHELVTRMRAVLRRSVRTEQDRRLTIGPLEIDPQVFMVKRDGVELHLTATEFKVLVEMARRPGQVFTRELLLSRVWDYDYLGDSRLVDVTVHRLRTKIEDDPKQPRIISTVRGVGYRLVGD